jgi:hypothetical protein
MGDRIIPQIPRPVAAVVRPRPPGHPPPAAVHEAAWMMVGGTNVRPCCMWRARSAALHRHRGSRKGREEGGVVVAAVVAVVGARGGVTWE